MPNNRFNKQVTPKGYKKGGGVDVKKAKEFRKNKKTPIRTFIKNTMEGKYMGDGMKGTAEPRRVVGNRRVRRKIGGVTSEAKKKQFKTNQAKQKETTKKVLKAMAGPFNPISAGQNVAKKIKDRMGRKMGGALKPVDPKTQKGLSKLPTEVRNKMGYMQDGGKVKKPATGLFTFDKQTFLQFKDLMTGSSDAEINKKMKILKDSLEKEKKKEKKSNGK